MLQAISLAIETIFTVNQLRVKIMIIGDGGGAINLLANPTKINHTASGTVLIFLRCLNVFSVVPICTFLSLMEAFLNLRIMDAASFPENFHSKGIDVFFGSRIFACIHCLLLLGCEFYKKSPYRN